MNKTDKDIIFLLVCIFVCAICIIAQDRNIEKIKKQNADYQRVIADYKKDIESPEFKAVKKCKKQNVWVAECITWELNK